MQCTNGWIEQRSNS